MAYGMARRADGSASPTVVYASFLRDGQPVAAAPDVVDYALAGGARVLITGHQPHGDAPAIMRCRGAGGRPSEGRAADGGAAEGGAVEGANELLVVTADTSFSNDVEWMTTSESPPAPPPPPPSPPPPPAAANAAWANPRGRCVMEVCIAAGASASAMPAVRIHGILSDGRGLDCDAAADARVGTLRDGWWVKGTMESGALLLSRGEGYLVQNREAIEEPTDS